jgi:hypothetical protein
MPHTNSSRRMPAATAAIGVLALVLVCLGLAACGGSSKSAATNASASASASTGGGTGATGAGATGTGATGAGTTGATGARAGAGRFKALRECLQQNGITLPQRTPGQRPRGGAGGLLGGGTGGAQLPKGVTRAQYQAALKKCGGSFDANGHFNRVNSPTFKTVLAKFSACMRENGVNIPAPNTSGKGPIFNTRGVNTTSAQFKTAETKCSAVLRSGFQRGGRGAAPGGAAPGSAAPGGTPSG